jgi:hypothetical protein
VALDEALDGGEADAVAVEFVGGVEAFEGVEQAASVGGPRVPSPCHPLCAGSSRIAAEAHERAPVTIGA